MLMWFGSGSGHQDIYMEDGHMHCVNCGVFPPILFLKSKVLFHFSVLFYSCVW